MDGGGAVNAKARNTFYRRWYGWHSVQEKVHVHDLHATILYLLGFDHQRLTYRHAGRDYRLTDVYGQIVKEALSRPELVPG